MSLPKKMDQQTVNELRSILKKMNISQSKVKINLDNQTIEVEDDYSIDDILESAGILTPEQAKRLTDEVKKNARGRVELNGWLFTRYQYCDRIACWGTCRVGFCQAGQ